MLRASFVFCAVCVAARARAQEHQSKELAEAAGSWRQQLTGNIPANKKQPGLVAGWRRMAEADLVCHGLVGWSKRLS
jgi:hypothetical protein